MLPISRFGANDYQFIQILVFVLLWYMLDNEVQIEYKQYRNLLLTLLKQSERSYFRNHLQTQGIKKYK